MVGALKLSGATTLTLIEQKLEKLRLEADEIELLKVDLAYAQKFREMLVSEPND